MKNGMTKKERLALFKAEKQASKLKRERLSLLADYLCEKAELVISSDRRMYVHDAMIQAYNYSSHQEEMEQRIRTLYSGSSETFVHRGGSFEFSPAEFFHWAENINPSLWGDVPSVLRALHNERLISFSLLECREVIAGLPHAIFKMVRL